MADFLQKHRKKGLLALLLLWFKEKKIVAVLLVVGMALSLVFISPSHFIGGAFGSSRSAAVVAWLAAKLGLNTTPGAGAFAGLLAAFRSARDGKNLSWNELFGRGAPGAMADSLGLVRGDASEFGLLAAADKAAKSVSGILNPEDALRAGQGVELNDSDLNGERAHMMGIGDNVDAGRNTLAGMNTGMPGASATSAAFAKKDFFAGDKSAGTRLGDSIKNAAAGTSVPKVGGSRITGVSQGRLSSMVIAKRSYSSRQAMNRNLSSRTDSPMLQLAQGRARGMMARDPNCTATNGCPAEYAATNAGAVYDGNKVGPSAPEVITATPVDGATSVSVPSDSLMQGYIDEGNEAAADAKACQEADARHEDRIQELSAKLEEDGKTMESMDCGGGGCSKSKARRCENFGNGVMKPDCLALNQEMYQNCVECPIMVKSGSCKPPKPSDCER